MHGIETRFQGSQRGCWPRPVLTVIGHFCILRIKIDKDTICVPCTGKNCFCLLILIQITLYYVAERRRGENFLRLWVSDTTFKHFEKFVAPTPVQKYLEQAIGHNNIEVLFLSTPGPYTNNIYYVMKPSEARRGNF